MRKLFLALTAAMLLSALSLSSHPAKATVLVVPNGIQATIQSRQLLVTCVGSAAVKPHSARCVRCATLHHDQCRIRKRPSVGDTY
jgi:hypothetical protein